LGERGRGVRGVPGLNRELLYIKDLVDGMIVAPKLAIVHTRGGELEI
jgi:hypothetical protein